MRHLFRIMFAVGLRRGQVFPREDAAHDRDYVCFAPKAEGRHVQKQTLSLEKILAKSSQHRGCRLLVALLPQTERTHGARQPRQGTTCEISSSISGMTQIPQPEQVERPKCMRCSWKKDTGDFKKSLKHLYILNSAYSLLHRQTRWKSRTQSFRLHPGNCHSRKSGWVALGLDLRPSFPSLCADASDY